MKFIADFHIHSKYSRATSKDMDIGHLEKWAKIKGIKVLGTGDFTHPLWLKELKENLEPAETGLYKIKNQSRQGGAKTKNNINWYLPELNQENQTRFILTAEISCIYSKNNRTRKIHLIIFAPSFEVVEKINTHLGWIGNLKSDGRPILGLDAKELLKIVLNISEDCLVVPGHIYTPWFSIFGSRSGFDSLEECFENYSKYIYAGETGLSSDPPMSWRNSALDKMTLISNSDSHSPSRIGREANVFDTEISYPAIIEAIKSKNPQKFIYTIEFFPEEGKYHFDGHRLCKVSFSPEETKKHKGLCPVCQRPLTIGVMNRVEELADRPAGFKPKGAVPFFSLIPLDEIIGDALAVGSASKVVEQEYKNLINKFGNEFKVILDASKEELQRATKPEIAEAIIRTREGRVKIEPGYDGEYGKIKIFGDEERNNFSKQTSLF